MHVSFPDDLFKPMKKQSSFKDEQYIILPYKINTTDKYRSDVLCLIYQNSIWLDPLFDNPKFGLDLEWDTEEWELIYHIPDKANLIKLIFNMDK